MDGEQDVPMQTSRYLEQVRREQNVFEKYSSLATLFMFSLGPASSLIQAALDSLETILFSKRFQNESGANIMSIVGVTPLPIMCSVQLALFLGQAITARVSRLLAEERRDAAQQVVVDVIRVAIVGGIIFPVCFVWAVKPFLKWTGCHEDILDPAFRFTLPSICGQVVISMFVISLSFLQAIGKTELSFMSRCVAYSVQVGILSPIFLWVFNISTDLCKVPCIIAEGVTAIILLTAMFTGKFSLNVPVRLFLQPFHSETWKCMMLAAPMILQFVCMAFPPVLIMKAMNQIDPVNSKEIDAVLGVWNKLCGLVGTIPITFGSGFLTPATYAYGSGNLKRMMVLFGWACLFSIGPLFIISPCMSFAPEVLASLFLSPAELEVGKQILSIPFRTSIVLGVAVMATMIMTVLGKPIYPAACGILQFLILSIGSEIAKRYVVNVYKVMYLINISDIVLLIAYTIIILVHIIPVIKKIKKEPEYTALTGQVEGISELEHEGTEERREFY